MTTYLLTDFDGVFAPIAQSPHEQAWPERESRETIESHGAPHSFFVYPEMIKRMSKVFDKPNVEGFWLTTWRGETDSLNKMLGLDLPEAGTPAFTQSGFSWKEQMVLDAYNQGARIVWIEDEPTVTMLQWIEKESDPARILCIIPVSYCGVTPEDMSRIEAFTS